MYVEQGGFSISLPVFLTDFQLPDHRSAWCHPNAFHLLDPSSSPRRSKPRAPHTPYSKCHPTCNQYMRDIPRAAIFPNPNVGHEHWQVAPVQTAPSPTPREPESPAGDERVLTTASRKRMQRSSSGRLSQNWRKSSRPMGCLSHRLL